MHARGGRTGHVAGHPVRTAVAAFYALAGLAKLWPPGAVDDERHGAPAASAASQVACNLGVRERVAELLCQRGRIQTAWWPQASHTTINRTPAAAALPSVIGGLS